MKNQQDQQIVSSLIIFAIGIIILLATCSGCSTTVPVTVQFPDAPKLGQGTCPQLQTVNDGVKLSELTRTVTVNYSTYYECAVRVDSWNEWYQIQKHIFESIK